MRWLRLAADGHFGTGVVIPFGVAGRKRFSAESHRKPRNHERNNQAVPSGPRTGGTAIRRRHRPLTSYANKGWVDDAAKIGVNPWGDDHKRDVAMRHPEYLSGEIPAISPGIGKDECSRCTVWNTVASDQSGRGRDEFLLDSPRAGGSYFISRTAAAMLGSRDERVKASLTAWPVDRSRMGMRCREVMSSSIEAEAHYRDLIVHHRVDRLLGFITEQTPRIGAVFSLTSQRITCAAMAWSESTDMEEVRSLPNRIVKHGWL